MLDLVLAHSVAWSPYAIDAHGIHNRWRDSFEPLEPAEVVHCLKYLAEGIACGEIQRTSKIKKRNTSYGWKHWAEHGLLHKPKGPHTYVSNGSFLAACHLLGVAMEQTEPCSLNAYLAIAWLPKPEEALWRPSSFAFESEIMAGLASWPG
ncbi:MAG: hypothetical protein Unbinned3992contig1000_36 [Prokaryotic dsDNA virus sp.]|nr:MAG: hypothetical protein Unbinned3992contig1000_36 [Prokaryotic dsDNA virus sp.]|tara:strand:+ start:5261 stop:5710 length:450 start_codon:yes stop_codon:yes gene_type:complete